MPLAVYVLGLSLFCMSTTEVMIVGMLPQLAMDLDVSLSTAGLLISGFALAIVVGGREPVSWAGGKTRPRPGGVGNDPGWSQEVSGVR